jgi:hypothetical protein
MLACGGCGIGVGPLVARGRAPMRVFDSATPQTSFFFGYMAMVCFGFFLMLGTVGWRASLMFVRHIYRAIKLD